jgi:ferric-dicitrate binding protein FerR (iron transport regulator)
MRDDEILDLFLAGELDEFDEARLEKMLQADPALVRELAELRVQDNALRVVLGPGEHDRRVTGSVLSVLGGKSPEEFKTELMERVRVEDAGKRRAEEADRAPVVIEMAPRRAARPPRARRPLLWAAAGVAAALAAAAGLHLAAPGEPDAPTAAYLLSAGPDVRVRRGGASVPVRLDMHLQAGDEIRGGEVRIRFAADPTTLDLRGDSELLLARGGRSKAVELRRGEVEASIAPQDDAMVLATPHAEARVREGRFRLSSAADFARLSVREGAALFERRSDGRSVRVEAGRYAVAGADAELVAREESPAPAPAASGVAVLRHVRGDVFVFAGSPADRAPAPAGRELVAGQGLVTGGAGSLAVVEYADGTRLEVGPDTTLRRLSAGAERAPAPKHVEILRGVLTADVMKQPADQPMLVSTPHAEVRVLGTRFLVSGEKDSTHLRVEEGAVRFTHRDRRSIEVRSGFHAVAGDGLPFEAAPIPGGARYLDLDLAAGVTDGPGLWKLEGRTVQQAALADATTRLFAAETSASVLLQATVDADRVAPDGEWGFGLAVRLGGQSVVLRSLQGGSTGSVLEFAGRRAIPFEHGREGTYRLRLRIERRRDMPAVLQGKIWQGDREPDGWIIEDELALEGPITRVGLETVRSACTFSRFRVELLK